MDVYELLQLVRDKVRAMDMKLSGAQGELAAHMQTDHTERYEDVSRVLQREDVLKGQLEAMTHERDSLLLALEVSRKKVDELEAELTWRNTCLHSAREESHRLHRWVNELQERAHQICEPKKLTPLTDPRCRSCDVSLVELPACDTCPVAADHDKKES